MPRPDSAPQILLLGAAGFIGQHIAFALRDAGIRVLASARNTSRLDAMGFETLQADLSSPKAQTAEFWQPVLENCTHVINCAGLLTGSDSAFQAVHVSAPKAVYRAMPKGSKAVLISAIGVAADTAFARYRRMGEEVAQNAPIPVTILRPGLVMGAGSYGGSSLARALAALPLITPVLGDGKQMFNPIHADDLAALVIEALKASTPPEPVELGGPGVISQQDLLASLRQWLGLSPARILHIPLPVARVMGHIGDALRLAPISATTARQLEQGVKANLSDMMRLFTFRPHALASFLSTRPSQTQDLWHARLYLLRPTLRLTLALMWLVSGLIGLLLPPDNFLPYVGGLLPDQLLIAAARISGAIDLLIALALLRAWHLKPLAWLQFTMVAGYTIGLSLIAPSLWLAPFGGVLKNLPILLLILIHRVLEEER